MAICGNCCLWTNSFRYSASSVQRTEDNTACTSDTDMVECRGDPEASVQPSVFQLIMDLFSEKSFNCLMSTVNRFEHNFNMIMIITLIKRVWQISMSLILFQTRKRLVLLLPPESCSKIFIICETVN